MMPNGVNGLLPMPADQKITARLKGVEVGPRLSLVDAMQLVGLNFSLLW
jgi:hypothetical protein